MSCCCGGETKVGIKGLAGRAEGAKAELTIGGMSCGSCARRIEKALSKLDGVREAVVDFGASRATVTYDPSDVLFADIEAAVRDLGYDTPA